VPIGEETWRPQPAFLHLSTAAASGSKGCLSSALSAILLPNTKRLSAPWRAINVAPLWQQARWRIDVGTMLPRPQLWLPLLLPIAPEGRELTSPVIWPPEDGIAKSSTFLTLRIHSCLEAAQQGYSKTRDEGYARFFSFSFQLEEQHVGYRNWYSQEEVTKEDSPSSQTREPVLTTLGAADCSLSRSGT